MEEVYWKHGVIDGEAYQEMTRHKKFAKLFLNNKMLKLN